MPSDKPKHKPVRTSTKKKQAETAALVTQPQAAADAAPNPLLLVNMVPRALSGETNQDSEPCIAVNPANPNQIVGTAFTPDPMGGSNAPIYISTDGGQTWMLNSIVPSVAGSALGTLDITVAFASATNNLYGGILRDSSANLQILRTKNFAGPSAMDIFVDRPNNDQPFTHAITTTSGNAQQDRVYVGNNDSQAVPATSTLDISMDGSANTPGFKSIRLEKRTTVGQNGPQIRPVAHPDGTVYAAFYGWRSETGDWTANTLVVTTDVVVVRDDQWGSSAAPFEALTDPSDGVAGRLVVQSVTIPFNQTGLPENGQQRLGGSLSIAVDPRNSSTVYIAWADVQPNTGYTVHVRSSADRGNTWAADLRTLPRSTNVALAVNSNGVLGMLYQQITGTSSTLKWETHFQTSADGVNWTDRVLATADATVPDKVASGGFDPYLGDYDHLVAVGSTFFGVFSMSNAPIQTNFPNGVSYQRNVDFANNRLLDVNGVNEVSISIDPFFFSVTI